jgi:zinc transport system ATP-binding protein
MSNTTILEVSKAHLSYDWGKSFILKDISFSLQEGEILSIIWKNGTGKSSLLKAIAGIYPLQSGSITKKTQKISYIPQIIHLEKGFPLKVQEFFHIFNGNTSPKEVSDMVTTFQAEHLIDRNIHTLSGWEFQRILIINALLSKPELLLLDEPTSGIDLIGEEQFYENIAQIQKTYPKIAIILVSHNLHLVYKNSNRVICLHNNNLCCHGTPSEILENKDINNIFGKYLRPYEHTPHTDHHHTH